MDSQSFIRSMSTQELKIALEFEKLLPCTIFQKEQERRENGGKILSKLYWLDACKIQGDDLREKDEVSKEIDFTKNLFT